MTGPAGFASGVPQEVLDTLRSAGSRVQPIPVNHGADGNANWHVRPRSGELCVLRRYHAGATAEYVRYENTILTFLGENGWCVSEPLSRPVEHDGR